MIRLELGDSVEVLKRIESASIDALVCDPPAGISFMGKEWDHDHGHRNEWIKAFASIFRECYRTMKPGAHGLVWALPRTSHWTATALEDAGFEVRDIIMHLFGTGFPKSLDVSKAIDKAAGAERLVVGERTFSGKAAQDWREKGGDTYNAAAPSAAGLTKTVAVTASATPEAIRWEGWGTALKPAAEHWILVRKPLDGTVAENVLAHGTGALNIDASRIGGAKRHPGNYVDSGAIWGNAAPSNRGNFNASTGRFPANVVLDEEAAALLDAQSGELTTNAGTVRKHNAGMGYHGANGSEREIHADTGGASRFFYVAKASKADKGADNDHPTPKNTKLMEYLIRMITPPGGVVLDCFMGSGSTGVAARALGFRFVGIERDPHYFEIAQRRLGVVPEFDPITAYD